MKYAYFSLACATMAGFLAITFIGVRDLGIFERDMSDTVKGIRDTTIPAIARDITTQTSAQLTGTRVDALKAVDSVIASIYGIDHDVMSRVDVSLGKVDTIMSKVDGATATVDLAVNGGANVKGLVPSINDTLSALQAIPWALAKGIDEANASMKPVATNMARITFNVAEALPDFTDCYADGFGNPNCLYNRYVGVAKSVEKGADAGEKIASDMAVLTAEGVALSKRLGGKTHWYDRVLGFTPTAIRAYEAAK